MFLLTFVVNLLKRLTFYQGFQDNSPFPYPDYPLTNSRFLSSSAFSFLPERLLLGLTPRQIYSNSRDISHGQTQPQESFNSYNGVEQKCLFLYIWRVVVSEEEKLKGLVFKIFLVLICNKILHHSIIIINFV